MIYTLIFVYPSDGSGGSQEIVTEIAELAIFIRFRTGPGTIIYIYMKQDCQTIYILYIYMYTYTYVYICNEIAIIFNLLSAIVVNITMSASGPVPILLIAATVKLYVSPLIKLSNEDVTVSTVLVI